MNGSKFPIAARTQQSHEGGLVNRRGAGRSFLLLMPAFLAIMVIGYMIVSDNRSFPWWLLIFAPLAIFIFLRPFVGLLIILALVPLESAFLGLGGGVLTVTRLLGIYVMAAWLIQLGVKRRKLVLPMAAKWAIAFMAWGAASYLWAGYQDAALESLQTAVQLLLLALLVVEQVNSRRRLEMALTALFVGCFSTTILGLLGIGVRNDYPLLSLGNQGAKEFGSYVGIIFLMGTVLSVFGAGRLTMFAHVATALSIVPLIGSGERGVVLALALACFAAAFVARRKTMAIAAIVLLLAILHLMPGVLAQAGLIDPAIIQRWTVSSIIKSGGTGRAAIWTSALTAVREHLWVGAGLGYFALDLNVRSTHNDWLGVAGELGLVGLSLFLAMLTSTGKRFVRVFDDELDSRRSLLAILVLALFVYSLSIGLTSTYMWRKIYWVILAMAISIPGLLARDSGAESVGERESL